MSPQEVKYWYNIFDRHIDHNVRIVGYGNSDEKENNEIDEFWDDITLECEDCNEVIMNLPKDGILED